MAPPSDLKPENILVSLSKFAVRIADFNAAYIDHAPLEDDALYSCDRLGSAPYMAWEVDQGRDYGKMIDWWALGCITFDMLTNTVSGRSPLLLHYACVPVDGALACVNNCRLKTQRLDFDLLLKRCKC